MKNQKTFQIACYALFLALLMLLTFTPVGYIPIGPIKATIIHLPVIFMGLVFGIKGGVLAGLMFGCSSLLANTLTPGVLSFCFSPFIQVGGTGGNWLSLIICFLPRIILGLSAGFIGKAVQQKMKLSLSVVGCALVHSLLVLGLIYLLFKNSYAQALSMDNQAVAIALMTTFSTQSIIEAVLAGMFAYFIYPFMQIMQKKVKR